MRKYILQNNKTTIPNFIHADACNFIDYPMGGTLSFSRQMMKAFGNKLALVGIVTDNTPCGKWIIKDIDGTNYFFFGIGKIKKTTSYPIVPERLQTYYLFQKSIKKISTLHVKKIFTQTPQFMLALNRNNWSSICFCFAGMGNSVSLSRYPFLRWLGPFYEKLLFKSIKNHSNCVLAAADKEEISNTILKSKGILKSKSINSFPTRFDDRIFYKKNQTYCRNRLKLNYNNKIIVTVGRLSWIKGWEFTIQTFEKYLNYDPTAQLIFVGDGEDRTLIETKYHDLITKGVISITGQITPFEVNIYINASDLFFLGSHQEGWPTAIVEALACGKPIVSTNVSGVREMVFDRQNGMIVPDRNPQKAAKAIIKSMKLQNIVELNKKISEKFKLNNLKKDLHNLWLNHF